MQPLNDPNLTKAEFKSSFKLGNPQHNMVVYITVPNVFVWSHFHNIVQYEGYIKRKISITLFTSVDSRDQHLKVTFLLALQIFFGLP